MGQSLLSPGSQHLKMSRFLQGLRVLTIALTAMAHAKAFPQQRQQQQQPQQQQRPGTRYEGPVVSGTVGKDVNYIKDSYGTHSTTHKVPWRSELCRHSNRT